MYAKTRRASQLAAMIAALFNAVVLRPLPSQAEPSNTPILGHFRFCANQPTGRLFAAPVLCRVTIHEMAESIRELHLRFPKGKPILVTRDTLGSAITYATFLALRGRLTQAHASSAATADSPDGAESVGTSELVCGFGSARRGVRTPASCPYRRIVSCRCPVSRATRLTPQPMRSSFRTFSCSISLNSFMTATLASPALADRSDHLKRRSSRSLQVCGFHVPFSVRFWVPPEVLKRWVLRDCHTYERDCGYLVKRGDDIVRGTVRVSRGSSMRPSFSGDNENDCSSSSMTARNSASLPAKLIVDRTSRDAGAIGDLVKARRIVADGQEHRRCSLH